MFYWVVGPHTINTLGVAADWIRGVECPSTFSRWPVATENCKVEWREQGDNKYHTLNYI